MGIRILVKEKQINKTNDPKFFKLTKVYQNEEHQGVSAEKEAKYVSSLLNTRDETKIYKKMPSFPTIIITFKT